MVRRTKIKFFVLSVLIICWKQNDSVLCHNNMLCKIWANPKYVNKLCHTIVVMFYEHDSRVYLRD